MYHCNSTQDEKYYVRFLLIVIFESQSFESFRIVNDRIYLSFRAICVVRRFFKNNDEWVSCFTKTVRFFIDWFLRCLFVIALMHEKIVNARALWNQFDTNICDDLSRQIHSFLFVLADFVDAYLNYNLYLIAQTLQNQNKILTNFDLSVSILAWLNNNTLLFIAIKLNYDVIE